MLKKTNKQKTSIFLAWPWLSYMFSDIFSSQKAFGYAANIGETQNILEYQVSKNKILSSISHSKIYIWDYLQHEIIF